jgi:integrase
MKACEHYAAYLEKQKTLHAPVKFSDAAKEFMEQITGQGRSARYLQDCRTRLARASKAFHGYIQTITASDIEAWLSSIKAAGSTRNNYRATLIALFSFARNRGYLSRNERTEAELTIKAVDRGGDIGIYTPAQLSVMLEGIEAKWVPLIALGAFAGLRTAEIHRLEWQDIDLHGGHIVVGKAKAKTAQRRIVPILPALRAWLEPIGAKSGFVVPHFSSDSKLLDSFRQSFETMNIQRVHNGLRHSYATYRLAAVQSADQVALETGNSPRKLFQNYRELATKAQAEKWFSVMPVQAEKVISIAG